MEITTFDGSIIREAAELNQKVRTLLAQTGIRRIRQDGTEWFSFADVCALLGLARPDDILASLPAADVLSDVAAFGGSAVSFAGINLLLIAYTANNGTHAKTAYRWGRERLNTVIDLINRAGRPVAV